MFKITNNIRYPLLFLIAELTFYKNYATITIPKSSIKDRNRIEARQSGMILHTNINTILKKYSTCNVNNYTKYALENIILYTTAKI